MDELDFARWNAADWEGVFASHHTDDVFVHLQGQAPTRGFVPTSIPESHRDLLDADVAILATVGRDGRPQLSAVWFVADGDTVAIPVNTARQKTKTLEENTAATLFILDRQNPFRYLELCGNATIEPDDTYAFTDRVGAKYQSDLSEHDGLDDQRVKVTIHALRVNAVTMGR